MFPCILKTTVVCGLIALLGQESIAQSPSIILDIDPAAPCQPFPHFWESMFGSGHANLTLRESWRRDAEATKLVAGVRYIRFHGIFDDENGVYSEDKQGNPLYNWTYVDQIYDGLLARGIRPFVELSFMPRALAVSQQPHAFWYRPLPHPPRSYAKWADLITNFARHLEDRYGRDEVREWYFEVWNEPNLDFWTGKPAQATYFQLYETTARALKSIDSRFRVGGPATAKAAWIGDFVRHCADNRIPLDFISTHAYASDSAGSDLDVEHHVARKEFLYKAASKIKQVVKSSPRPELPIIWSEYNVTDRHDPKITDSAFMGPWLANNIRLCDGLTTMMSYWTFSDVFEEQGVVKTPFYGGFGLIATGGIPKASYNAFAMLHRLGNQRLNPSHENAIVTKRDDHTIAIVVWNYAEPEEKSLPKVVEIRVANYRSACVAIVDDEHGSAWNRWQRMGKPAFPTPVQQRELQAVGRLPSSEPLSTQNGTFRITVAPRGLALVEIGY